MTGPIDPIRRTGPAARVQQDGEGDGAWREGHEGIANLPAVIEGETLQEQAPPLRPRRATAGAYDAQYLGQDGQKRGLRGGREVLDTARAAYLETEFSGPNDRRPKKGLIKKTEI